MAEKKLGLRVAAKAVIVVDNEVLALHPSSIDANRKWHIPGGIRDDIDEPIVATAIREVTEETGIDLSEIPALVVKVGEWTAVDKGEEVKILAIFFLFKISQKPNIKLSEEHDDFAWLNTSNYREYELNPEVIDLVEKVAVQ